MNGLPGSARRSLRRYVESGLRLDVAVVGVTLVALFAAAFWPSISYLALLAALAVNIWFLGRLRRARAESERHVAELNRVNTDLEHHMEEARTLSEELGRANEALEDALVESERTAGRASALQDVTTALSVASTTSEIASAVLAHGLRAMQATRGHLVLADNDGIIQIVGAVGADEREVMQLYSTADDNLPLIRAIRERHSVWLRSAGEVDACFPKSGGEANVVSVEAHLALPLIHGGEVVGGLAFDFAFCPAIHATDELFTTLLAQATADALLRARSYDEEREARRTAELMSHAREEVLGVVAHDLRNPLNLVSMTTQLLMEPDLTPDRRQSTYAISARAVQRMNRLIGDLLDVVRMEAGHLSLNLGPSDVSQMLNETMDSFRARAAEQGISLVLSPEPPHVVVQADEERVLQLIDNLVGNALKFTPEGGQITIGGLVDGDELRVTVADTGPGISEEQRARLFERFWQARDGDRRGLGLGLPIAKGIAEAHGGKLWVDSTVGSGTTFHFDMPISR